MHRYLTLNLIVQLSVTYPSVVKVNREDMLQSIDSMPAEQLKLVSDYIMKLSEDEGSDIDAK